MVTGRGVLANCTGSKTGNFVDRAAARTFRVSRHGEITALETRPRGFDGGQASGSEGVETEPTMIEDGCRQGPADHCRTTQQARHNPRPQARSFTVFPLTLTLTSASTSGNSIVATPPPQHTASLLVPGASWLVRHGPSTSNHRVVTPPLRSRQPAPPSGMPPRRRQPPVLLSLREVGGRGTSNRRSRFWGSEGSQGRMT